MGLSKALSKTFRKFTKDTSITGVNRASRSTSWFRWSYWMLTFLVFTYYTINGVVQVTMDYYNYPHITNTDFIHQKIVPFPAITFCSLNRAHCENLLSEMILLERKLESADGEDADADAKLRMQFEIVGEIFASDSGCKKQVCEELRSSASAKASSGLSEMADDAEQLWSEAGAAMLMESINCAYLDMKMRNEPICLHLRYLLDYLEMDEPPPISGNQSTIKSDAQRAWEETFQCEVDSTCQMMKKMMDGGSGSDGGGGGGGGGEGGGQNFRATPSCASYVDGIPGNNGNNGNNAGDQQNTGGTEATVTVDNGNSSDEYSNETISTTEATIEEKDVYSKTIEEAEFTEKYLKLNGKLRRNIGHRRLGSTSVTGTKVKGFLKECQFQGTDCLENVFWAEYTNSAYGNCYTFNSFHNPNKSQAEYPLQVSLTGIEHGLRVSFNLDQSQYMGNKLSKKAGVRVVVHDPEKMPSPVDEGFDLQPNTASSISLQRVRMERLPYPYSASCINHWNETTNYTHLQDAPIKYAFSTCEGYCIQMEIIKSCGCYHPRLTQFGLFDTFAGDPCLIYESGKRDRGHNQCVGRVFRSKDEGAWSCPCHMDCVSVDFTKTVTQSTWPSEIYWQSLAVESGFTASEVYGPDSDDIKSKIAVNLLQANIYFHTTEMKHVKQTAKYTGNALWSSIGGALSLYLGMAVVMLFEVVELAMDLVLTACNHRKHEMKITHKSNV